MYTRYTRNHSKVQPNNNSLKFKNNQHYKSNNKEVTLFEVCENSIYKNKHSLYNNLSTNPNTNTVYNSQN